jgi:putative lipoprotein
VQTRRILELTLGAAALIAVVAAVVVSIGSTPETAQADSVDDTLTVTGNVSYRERIAFPENAVVTVRLEDISLADAPATLLAEQRIEDATGVPVPFELAAYRDAIDPGTRLAVRAQIEVDGTLRWTTDTVHPIPVEGAVPAQELILVAVPQ